VPWKKADQSFRNEQHITESADKELVVDVSSTKASTEPPNIAPTTALVPESYNTTSGTTVELNKPFIQENANTFVAETDLEVRGIGEGHSNTTQVVRADNCIGLDNVNSR
jgi:hypothetical protein